MISLDPTKCIIRNESFYFNPDKPATDKTSYTQFFKELDPFKGYVGKFIYGKIMNIYINFNRIEELLEDVDEDGNISLFTLVSNICSDINDCFGNFTNLEPIITEKIVPSSLSKNIEDIDQSNLQTGNTIVILDQTYIPGIETIKQAIEGVPGYQPAILDIYGFNKNIINSE